MAREGDRAVAFYIGQFKIEEALTAGANFKPTAET
jgi:hypothetical protein